jgi:hypothetical protein
MNLPIYALKDGKIYPFNLDEKIIIGEDGRKFQKKDAFNEVSGTELTLGGVIDSQREIDQEEKLRLATSVVEINPFRINTEGEFEMFNAYSRGTYDMFNNRKGYESLLVDQELHKKRVLAGIEESEPCTPEDVLKKVEERLEELKKRVDVAETNKRNVFSRRDMKKEVYSLYGFALNAQENGDANIFEAAKTLINKFGSFDDCANMIAKRVDEKGDFRTLDTDVPIEIRQKMIELRSCRT